MATSLLQKIFNRVSQHLLKQKAKSHLPNDTSKCAYRGMNGLQCAIGCLIKDEYYSSGLENLTPTNDDVATALDESLGADGVLHTDHGLQLFLCRLQRVHDHCAPHEWKGELKSVASQYYLQLPTCLKPKLKPKTKKGI